MAQRSTGLRLAWALGLCAATVASLFLVASLRQPGVSWNQQFTEDFNSGRVLRPEAVVRRDGFRAGPDGWYLPSSSSGSFVYRISKEPGQDVVIRLWVYSLSGVRSVVRVAADGSPMRTLIENADVSGAILDLPEGRGARTLDVEVDATNTSDRDQLVLDQLHWDMVAGTPPLRAPLYVWLGPAAVVLLIMAGRASRLSGLMAAAGATAVLAVASANRLAALYDHAAEQLDPDAVGYRVFGDSFQWWPPWDYGLFSANFGIREPLFPLVTHGFFDAFGSSDFHLRLVSAVFSVVAVGLTVVAARRRLAWPLSLTAGALVALNANLVNESFRGLRTELEMALLLASYALLDRSTATSPAWDGLASGITGAALVLTRVFYLPLVLAGAVVSAVGRYRPWRRALRPIVIVFTLTLLVTAGHRLAMAARHGDPYWDIGVSARAYANDERFLYNRPLPHPELFESVEEYRRTGCCEGPPITYSQYLFGMHTTGEVIGDTLLGYWEIFTNIGGFYVPGATLQQSAGLDLRGAEGFVDAVVRWLGLAGLIGLVVTAWKRPRNLLVPTMVFGGLSFSTFLYDRGLMEPIRNTIVVYPFLIFAAGWAIEHAFARVRRGYIRARST